MKTCNSTERALAATFTRDVIRPGCLYRVTPLSTEITIYMLGIRGTDKIAVDIDTGVLWGDGGIDNIRIEYLPDAIVDVGTRCHRL